MVLGHVRSADRSLEIEKNCTLILDSMDIYVSFAIAYLTLVLSWEITCCIAKRIQDILRIKSQ